MELHYILVVLVILAIIIAQISIYRNTKKKISTYKSIFPNSKSSYSIVEMAIQTNNTAEDRLQAERAAQAAAKEAEKAEKGKGRRSKKSDSEEE